MALKNTFECNNKICPNDHIDLHKAYVKYYSINDYIIMANTPEKKLDRNLFFPSFPPCEVFSVDKRVEGENE